MQVLVALDGQTTGDREAHEPDRNLGDFRLIREVGRGGMGSVFVALDEKFGEKIALKVAAASGTVYEDFKARFVREARLGNRLGKEKGFVRAFDWGELGDSTLYLAMDLVSEARPLELRTGSLEDKLARLASLRAQGPPSVGLRPPRRPYVGGLRCQRTSLSRRDEVTRAPNDSSHCARLG